MHLKFEFDQLMVRLIKFIDLDLGPRTLGLFHMVYDCVKLGKGLCN